MVCQKALVEDASEVLVLTFVSTSSQPVLDSNSILDTFVSNPLTRQPELDDHGPNRSLAWFIEYELFALTR